MADTPRTRAALQALFADNNSGDISAQDLRDFLVTALPAEFVNAYDAWAEPLVANMTDKTVRGWILYSQTVDSTVSFGNVVCMTSAGNWRPAHASTSTLNRTVLGLVADSYTQGATNVQVLRCGLLYDSAYSVIFTDNFGMPVYLLSVTQIGKWSVTPPTAASIKIIGHAEGYGVLRFDPDNWTIVGN